MPYTAKQRRYFHAQAAKGKPGMKKLAEEADAYARQGKEKKPVAAKKMPAKITKKQMPAKPAEKRAAPGAAKKAPAFMPKRPSAAKKAAAPKYTPKKRGY